MMSALFFGHNRRLVQAMGGLFEQTACEEVGADCRVHVCATADELARALDSGTLWSVACVDIGQGTDLGPVRSIRGASPSAELLIVVNEGVSPTAYIRPGIMPTGLVTRPASVDAVRETMLDFVRYVADKDDAGGGQAFVMESKDGVTRLPFASILCFEARAKRISVRLRHEEYTYYDTLSHLQQSLPDNFVRVHRGYIVNVDRIRSLRLAEDRVVLEGDLSVPVSRSYKAALRERMT